MRRVILPKLNPTQRERISELIDLCCQAEPIRLSIPLPKPGEALSDECFFALYEEGTLVSVIHLFYPDHTVGELIGFTHPAYRRRGYFRKLLDLASDHADHIGLEQVYVISDGNSPDANRALRTLGLAAQYAEYMLEKSLCEFEADETGSSPRCSVSDTLTLTETDASPLTAQLFSVIFEADLPQCEAYLEEITANERIRTYVLSRNDTPAGQTQLTFIDDMAYLSGFGILPEYRRNGFGLTFLRLLENHLAAQGFAKLTLQVSSQNKNAFSLYRKDGFETLEALSYYPLFEEG